MKEYLFWPKFSHVIFVTTPIFGLYNYQNSTVVGDLLQLLVQQHQGPLLCFLESFGFYQACLRTRQLWNSSLFITKEVDGAKEKGSIDTTLADVQTLMEDFFQTWDQFYSTAKAFGFPKYQLPDYRNCTAVTLMIKIFHGIHRISTMFTQANEFILRF